jgi:hypothetical protein
MLFQSLLSALLVFILPVSAQFQFFEQMFNQGGQQQQQQPQNAGSDSAWYQQRYEDGEITLSAACTSRTIALALSPKSKTRLSLATAAWHV